MFNTEDIYLDINVKELLNKVSEYDIFRYYCSNFKEVNRSFNSEFYNDKNPSCRIYEKPNGGLAYKDFGTGDYLNCFDYVMKKYNCTFKECLQIISNDFNLNKNQLFISPKFILGKEDDIKKDEYIKPQISIIPRNWNIVDYNYWNKYCINFDKLDEYDVIPCEYVYLYRKDKTLIFKYSKSNPIYAYKFTDDTGNTVYKIYSPLAEKRYKWLFSGKSNDIEGFNQLPLHGDILILTKSLKDCICFNLIGYPAISLQGEANKLDVELVYKILKRFNKIIVNYDNDDQGIRSTNKLVKQYGFDYFYIDDAKDLSEYIEKYGLEQAKIMINNKINKNDKN